MATYINVTGEQGPGDALLETNRSDQATNRRSRIEDERDAETEANAISAKEKKDAVGDPEDRKSGGRRLSGTIEISVPALSPSEQGRRPGAKFHRRDPVRGKPGANRKPHYPLAGFYLKQSGDTLTYYTLDGSASVNVQLPQRGSNLPNLQNVTERTTDGDRYTTWRYERYALQAGGDGSEVYLALPAGKQTLVIVYASKSDIISVYSKWGFTEVFDDLLGTRAYSVDIPFSSEIYESISTEFSYCVVIGEKFARRIPVPGPLVTALEPFTRIASPFVFSEPFYPYAVPGFYEPFEPIPLQEVSYLKVGVQHSDRKYYYDTSGIGRAVGRYASTFVTPGVFSLISNPSIFDDNNLSEQTLNDLNYISKTYLNGLKPKVALYHRYPDNVATVPGVYTGTVRPPKPDNGDTPLRSNKKGTYLQSQYPEIYSSVFVWDWGMPSYCRQKLYSLGFTPEDLAPPPQP